MKDANKLLIVAGILIFLALTNPSQSDYTAWAKAELFADQQAGFLQKFINKWTIEEDTSKMSYLFGTVYTTTDLKGIQYKTLGIANNFFSLGVDDTIYKQQTIEESLKEVTDDIDKLASYKEDLDQSIREININIANQENAVTQTKEALQVFIQKKPTLSGFGLYSESGEVSSASWDVDVLARSIEGDIWQAEKTIENIGSTKKELQSDFAKYNETKENFSKFQEPKGTPDQEEIAKLQTKYDKDIKDCQQKLKAAKKRSDELKKISDGYVQEVEKFCY